MGLDSAWVKMCIPGKTAPEVTFNPPLNLIGGLFSGHGQGSFRGKCYAARIEELTGVSIYQEWISNNVIHSMADKLTEWRIAQGDYPNSSEVDSDDDDLVRMFRKYADAGFGLVGWW